MSSIPQELQYTKEHEWVSKKDVSNTLRIGITDYAQEALGDIVYIQLPKLGDNVISGNVCGEIESTKSVSEIYSPLTGKIVAINSTLESAPETINTDPYGSGWIAEIEIEGDAPQLLSAADYASLTA
jgi:glycine cleavage system H protein